jgi:hypothetical protein
MTYQPNEQRPFSRRGTFFNCCLTRTRLKFKVVALNNQPIAAPPVDRAPPKAYGRCLVDRLEGTNGCYAQEGALDASPNPTAVEGRLRQFGMRPEKDMLIFLSDPKVASNDNVRHTPRLLQGAPLA